MPWLLAVLAAAFTTFMNSFATAAGERLAKIIVPEAKALGVPPHVIDNIALGAATPQDSLAIQTAIVRAATQKPEFAKQIQTAVEGYPQLHSVAKEYSDLFEKRPDVAAGFRDLKVTLKQLNDSWAAFKTQSANNSQRYYNWTKEQRDYAATGQCPVGHEELFWPDYRGSDAKETYPNQALVPYVVRDGKTIPNLVEATCMQGHHWKVYAGQ